MMGNKFDLAYPDWFLLFCIALGVAYAMFMYFRERQFTEQSRLLKAGMAFLRGLAVAILAFLLLSPVLKHLKKETRMPVIVIGQDVSASVLERASSQDSLDYLSALTALSERLGNAYSVERYAFGEEVRKEDTLTFSDKTSDIAEFLQYVGDHYADQNLGAVIMATDGLYNRGQNPVYTSGTFAFPVYSIALGDTTVRPDQNIRAVFHNQIAYLGDKFSIQVDLQAKRMSGTSSEITVAKAGEGGNRALESRQLRIDDDLWFKTEEFILEADEPGVQQYRISVSGIRGETSFANNSKLIAVEVIDGRQDILILGSSPHPDLTAMKSAIQNHKNYEVTLALAREFNGNPADFDFIILHQIPSDGFRGGTLLDNIRLGKIPHLFVLGSQSNLAAFNGTQDMMRIEGAQRNPNLVQADPVPGFDLFTLEEPLAAAIASFVPMLAPYGNYTVSPSATVFMTQRIGKVETDYPLFVFNDQNGIKTGVLAGEGYWKWRLNDFLERQDHAMSEAVLQKAVQYMTIKEDKRKFRVSSNKALYLENEEIEFSAEIYNESYEKITTPEVFLNIRDQENNEYRFAFSRYDKSYRLQAGRFPVGRYRYQAYTDLNGERLTAEGSFTVQAIQLEAFDLTANHNILQSISQATGGAVFYPENVSAISEAIEADPNIKPLLYQSMVSRSLIHLRWVAFLLVFLLCLEWFLRRYFGGY